MLQYWTVGTETDELVYCNWEYVSNVTELTHQSIEGKFLNKTKLRSISPVISRFALLGCLLGIGLVPAYADLVSNPTFAPCAGCPSPGSFTTLSSGSTVIPGWTVTGPQAGGVDWIGTYWTAPGGNSIDLDGTPGPGGIETTVATTAGDKYTLDFYLNVNPGDHDGSKSMNVSITGNPTTPFTMAPGNSPYWNSPTSTNYTLQSVSFTATGGSTTIAFTSTDPGVPYSGLVIADVNVVPSSASVPESSFGALALGLSGLTVAFIAVRRRKIA